MKGSGPLLKRTVKINCLCTNYSEFHDCSGSFRKFFTSYVDGQDVGYTCQPVGCGRCTQSAQILWSIPNVIKAKIHSDNVFTPALELVPNVVFAVDNRSAMNNSTGTPNTEDQQETDKSRRAIAKGCC